MILRMRNEKVKGFTLIEILIAMAIMGILASVGFGSYIRSLKKGRDAQRKSDLNQVQSALEAYMSDFQVYPGCNSEGKILGCGDGDTVCEWGDSFVRNVGDTTKTYMSRLPDDPVSGASYVYVSNGDQYQLFSVLENGQDPDYVDSYTIECGEEACKYGVPSPNNNMSTEMAIADHCSL